MVMQVSLVHAVPEGEDTTCLYLAVKLADDNIVRSLMLAAADPHVRGLGGVA